MSHLWHKPAKPRAKLSDRITWNGTGESFLAFKQGIEGHLLQVGAGYLLHSHFQYYYKDDPAKCQKAVYYFSDNPIWEHHEQSCYQIRFDKEYFYGVLVTAMRNISNKTILKHTNDKDGILAWMELKEDYDYDGSAQLRMEHLDKLIHTPYSDSQPDGLAGYIDQFMTAVNEIEIIQEEDYPDTLKKRYLLSNIRGMQGAPHLLQTCWDRVDWTFEEIATYLRKNSKNIEFLPSNRQSTMTSSTEKVVATVKAHLTLQETINLFENVAKDSSVFVAYQSFNTVSLRESLQIHTDIWKQLGPTIQGKIEKIKADLHAKRAAKQTPPCGEKGSIPAQTSSMRKTNKAKFMELERTSMAALCEKLSDMTNVYNAEDTDDEELYRYAYTSVVTPSADEDDTMMIRAHLEYTQESDKHYGISDSGADSSILGKYAHVTAYTGRYAYLVGYDPITSRSAKIPIVSGYIKVMAHCNLPVILEVHEAPFHSTSPITLISEYQARDFGTIIDSVSTKHKTIAGTFGTQRMVISPDLHIPFVDRGGLMGFEILPWQHGDEERYKIFSITRNAKWTPRRHLKESNHIDAGVLLSSTSSEAQMVDKHTVLDASSPPAPNINIPDSKFQDAQQDDGPTLSNKHVLDEPDLLAHGHVSPMPPASIPRPTVVPRTSKDTYSGCSPFSLYCLHKGIDTSIAYYPVKGKMDYPSVGYSSEYSPPEQRTLVNVPTKSKKTEPIQDVVPKVKGIRGTPPPFLPILNLN
jgi:hypothetical protein